LLPRFDFHDALLFSGIAPVIETIKAMPVKRRSIVPAKATLSNVA
jgi:hypothetical protein